MARFNVPRTCPPVGQTNRPPARIGWRGAMTTRTSGLPWDRTRGRNTSSRRLCSSGRPAARAPVSRCTPPSPTRQGAALLGVRACELHAIAVQDKVFLDRAGEFTDPYYARARERLFLVAVECEFPGGTCFCTSMGTGPEVIDPSAQVAGSTEQCGGHSFFDLALTELDLAFVARAGSPAGQVVLERLALAAAAAEDVSEARRRVAAATEAMGRTVDVTDIRNLLHSNQEHPRWDDVATRCLACTNCTLVCPTCFCSSVEDVTDLSLENATRVRQWDSCFNPEFARVHGGNFRASIRGRYRQWLTHKFASWYDQFGVSGCVGCGRCITWCPVGIDVTEEITAIRATSGQRGATSP